VSRKGKREKREDAPPELPFREGGGEKTGDQCGRQGEKKKGKRTALLVNKSKQKRHRKGKKGGGKAARANSPGKGRRRRRRRTKSNSAVIQESEREKKGILPARTIISGRRKNKKKGECVWVKGGPCRPKRQGKGKKEEEKDRVVVGKKPGGAFGVEKKEERPHADTIQIQKGKKKGINSPEKRIVDLEKNGSQGKKRGASSKKNYGISKNQEKEDISLEKKNRFLEKKRGRSSLLCAWEGVQTPLLLGKKKKRKESFLTSKEGEVSFLFVCAPLRKGG